MKFSIKDKVKEHGLLLITVEAIMVMSAIVGSSILALNIDISKWGYVLFTISSMAGIFVGIKRHVLSLTMLNIYFTIVNITGTFRWFM